MSPTNTEPEVYESHPELFHYTNWAGLQGIITSRSIWATRYDDLNDRSEVHHLRDKLTQSLRQRITVGWRARIGKSLKIKRQVDRAGGLYRASQGDAHNFVDAIYRVSFEGFTGSVPFCIPYISSFCSHCDDDEYAKKNGLLSQWRAYGGNERYAIVFDTRKLSNLLRREHSKLNYVFLQFGDVVYNDDKLDFDAGFSKLIDLFATAYDQWIDNRIDDDVMGLLYNKFMSAATRFKHRAFKEEREVRIVASPCTIELRDHLIQKTGIDESQNLEIKKIKLRGEAPTEIAHISLLEDLSRPLPIRRIVVGPCPDQETAPLRVRRLVDGKIDIIKSETPFVR